VRVWSGAATPLPEAETITVALPVVAVAEAVKVSMDEQFGVQLVGENMAVTPLGRPEEMLKVTG